MNHTQNDRGEDALAVGAPGSVERVKKERPELIGQLDQLYLGSLDSPGRGIDQAVEMIRAAGIKNPLETNSILAASNYSREPEGSVTALVTRVGNAPPTLPAEPPSLSPESSGRSPER